MSWLLRMAWRDTRTARRRLLLYTASITLGVAALVSIHGLGENMREAVRRQSAELLGADLVVRADQPIDEETLRLLAATFGDRRAQEVQFASMILHPRSGASRLVSVRAVEPAFPFYGAFSTQPAGAAEAFRRGEGVLVEENVMLQFGAKPGDELRIGTASLPILGALRSVPGESVGFNLVAPRVYMPLAALDATGLVKKGSRVRYRVHVAADAPAVAEAFRRAHAQALRERGVRIETVETRQARMSRSIGRLESFLGLVAYVALLLGGVGVASGIHVFVRQKLTSIAVLRCVGATVRQTLAIYLIQAAGMGLAGALAGCALGVGLQMAIPLTLGDMLPADFRVRITPPTLVEGLAAGVGITVALALLPLLGVRRVSPLLALRSAVEGARRGWRDPARLAVVAVGAGAVALFAIGQAAKWQHGVGLVAGTAVVFAALATLGRGLMVMARHLALRGAPYVVRQGVANLFRPNNRTLLVVLALGLGAFLVVTMQLTQRSLVRELELSDRGGRSNVVLFDIQDDQREAVRATLEAEGLPVFDEAPVVTMRLASVKGRTREAILADPDRKTPRWVLNREYRSTYRGGLNEAERLVAGTFTSRHAMEAGPVPVSIEADIAEDLGVSVGDALQFDVQGVPVDCVVGSIREVDTRRVAPFFFVVFPEGVLEDAPKFIIMTTRVADSAQSARLQRVLFERFPNVSVVDLMLILDTLNDVLDRVGFIFRFMAAFIVGTGLVVLAGVMASGRFQRLRETVLLRTLGGSRRQIALIQLVEYWVLGTVAGLAGVALAWLAAWGIGWWIFDIAAVPDGGPLVWAWLAVSTMTTLTGALSGRRLLDHPPLELLRQEV